MPFGFGGQKIQVTIINSADGKVIVKAAQRPEDIPERFDVPTKIHLGDRQYSVDEADAVNREAYKKAGKLTLKVTEVHYMSPQNILFSLPTIADCIGNEIPADTAGQYILEMHEDDWCQIELVCKSHMDLINKELSSIRAIFLEQRTEGGAFQKIHVRELIKEPLGGCNITLTALQSRLGSEPGGAFDGIAYYTSAGPTGNALVVQDGFAFEGAGGLIAYGQTKGDVCTTFGIMAKSINAPACAAAALSGVLQEYDLTLVDWCRTATADSQIQLEAYFDTLGTTSRS